MLSKPPSERPAWRLSIFGVSMDHGIWSWRHTPQLYLSLFLFLGMVIPAVLAAEPGRDGLAIVSPANGSVVPSGQPLTVTVSANANSGVRHVQVVGDDIGSSEAVDGPPFTFTLFIPDDLTGPRQLTATGVFGPDDVLSSPPITIDIEPVSDLTSMEVEPKQLYFDYAGQQLPLTVTGTFADGTVRDIRFSSRITYSSSDPTLAKVDAMGLVTAVGEGNADSATIRVQYSGLSITLPVSAARIVAGDLNGDGVVDQEDINVILDALNTPATGPSDPRDQNHDGVIDQRDAQQLISLCTQPPCDIPAGLTDTVPPTTLAVSTPAPNSDEWNNTDVRLALTATDNPGGTGVKEIHYAIDADPESVETGSSAAVSLASEGVFEIRYYSIDHAGNREPAHRLTVRIDKTPPEAFFQYDPIRRDIQVFGRDSLSGVTFGPVIPSVAVLPRRIFDDSDKYSSSPEDKEETERRTYKVTDLAGNSLILVEEVKRRDHEITSQTTHLQYNDGKIFVVSSNRKHFEWKTDKNEELKELEQGFDLGSGQYRQSLEAKFKREMNLTAIKRDEPRRETTTYKLGLVLPRVITDQGKLLFEY